MKVARRRDMKRALHMRMEDQQWSKLDAMCLAVGLTQSEVVRRLIDAARYSPVILDTELRPNGVSHNHK